MRIRSTKPEFWQDEKMARELSRDARLLYKALWSEADDEGRLRGNHAYLHGTLFPYDPGSWFADALQQIIQTGRAVPYEADGGSYLWLPKMVKNQRIDKPTPSRLPPPPDQETDASREPRENLATDSRLPRPVASSGERVASSGERVARNEEQVSLQPGKPVAMPASEPNEKPSKSPERRNRLRVIPMDENRNHLSSPERIRRGFYAAWQTKYGSPYPQKPGADDQAARTILDYHRSSKLEEAWPAFAQRVVQAYLEMEDDKLVMTSRHAMNILGTKLGAIVATIGAK